jgi:hypothetical protein
MNADSIQYALETDWLAGAGGFEPLHFRIGIRQDSQPGRQDSNLCILDCNSPKIPSQGVRIRTSILPPGRPANVPYRLLGAVSSYGSCPHRCLLRRKDKPDLLPYAISSFCPVGPDGEHRERDGNGRLGRWENRNAQPLAPSCSFTSLERCAQYVQMQRRAATNECAASECSITIERGGSCCQPVVI